MFDILIKDGCVVDGTGSPARIQDIGIRRDKISTVGILDARNSHDVVMAQGHLVCPGFIDMHAHSDFNLLVQPAGRGKIYQGVTTEVCGNCGVSGAPLAGPALEQVARGLTNCSIRDRASLTTAHQPDTVSSLALRAVPQLDGEQTAPRTADAPAALPAGAAECGDCGRRIG